MPTPQRDLSNPEFCHRSLERARRRRRAADAVRRQLARRRKASAAVLTAMLAGPPVQLAAAQTGGDDDDSAPTESPVRAGDAQPDSLFFSVGSQGAAVADIQRALGVAADGIFGPDTDRAVRAYQAKRGLAVDGIVGPRTWASLFGGQAATQVPPAKQAAPAPADDGAKASAPRKGGLVFVLDGGKQAEDKAPKAKRAKKEPKVVKFKIRPIEKPKSRKVALDGGGGPCTSTLRNPVPGSTLNSPFGPRWGRNHNGQDLGAPSGTPVRAAACGIVVELGMQGGYGNMVCIKHSSRFTTCYAHLSGFSARMGERVRAGEVIGFVGCTGSCTGPHLHFETRVNGRAQDPSQYLRSSGGRSYRKAKAYRASGTTTASSSRSSSGYTPGYSQSSTGTTGSSYSSTSGGSSYQPQAQSTPTYQAPQQTQQVPTYQRAPQAQPAPQQQPAEAPVEQAPAQGGQGQSPAGELPAVEAPEVPGVTAPEQSGGSGGDGQQVEQPQATQPAGEAGDGSSGSGAGGSGSSGSGSSVGEVVSGVTGSGSSGSGAGGSGSTGSGPGGPDSTGASQGAGAGAGQ